MAQNLKLKVSERIQETDDTVSIYFHTEGKIADFYPGQFLTFVLNVNGQSIRRSYSICSAPDELPRIGVAVKRVPGGLGSNYLIDNLNVGDEVELIEPYGTFNINHKRSELPTLVLFGGGSGITPLMSIILTSLKNYGNKIYLFYGNRTEDSIIFKNKLKELQSKYPNRLIVEHLLSRPEENDTQPKRRIDSDLIRYLLVEHDLLHDHSVNYYVCGPQGLMETVLDRLPELGIEKERIHKESFFTSNDSKSDVEDLDKPDPADMPDERIAKVVYEGDEYDVTVPKGEYILDCALDHGIDLPYACQSGICGMCRATKVKGELLIHDQEAISEEEIAEGACLTCCAEPLSDGIVISYDD